MVLFDNIVFLQIIILILSHRLLIISMVVYVLIVIVSITTLILLFLVLLLTVALTLNLQRIEVFDILVLFLFIHLVIFPRIPTSTLLFFLFQLFLNLFDILIQLYKLIFQIKIDMSSFPNLIIDFDPFLAYFLFDFLVDLVVINLFETFNNIVDKFTDTVLVLI